MKSLNEYILEAKFTGLSQFELNKLDELLQNYMDVYGFNPYYMLPDCIKQSGEYGEKYLISFYKPNTLLSLKGPYGVYFKKINNRTDMKYCIGISDKFGRIFLQGFDENMYLYLKNNDWYLKKESEKYPIKMVAYIIPTNILDEKIKITTEFIELLNNIKKKSQLIDNDSIIDKNMFYGWETVIRIGKELKDIHISIGDLKTLKQILKDKDSNWLHVKSDKKDCYVCKYETNNKSKWFYIYEE